LPNSTYMACRSVYIGLHCLYFVVTENKVSKVVSCWLSLKCHLVKMSPLNYVLATIANGLGSGFWSSSVLS